ncbi:MAG: NTP transferase domain-containing protein [Alphaproteobacteria bacterium]|nr:NTP transferase domain-containing protein [Alphaproteobacteria bacterium]
MTGAGSRFRAAGYDRLKPLIPVLERPIIEWVAQKIFPGEADILFICRQKHLDEIPDMRAVLSAACPSGRIVALDAWEKKGPLHDVMQVQEEIDDARPAVVSYCDFYQTWDWQGFKNDFLARGCDGAIPCYTGFHPHLLHPWNVYASCRTDDDDNLLEIREKFSFHPDKMQARHSPGVYAFKTGALLKTYFGRDLREGEAIAGEHYASLPYNAMVRDGLSVWAPANVRYFCQWGTPRDLEESLFWIEAARSMNS